MKKITYWIWTSISNYGGSYYGDAVTSEQIILIDEVNQIYAWPYLGSKSTWGIIFFQKWTLWTWSVIASKYFSFSNSYYSWWLNLVKLSSNKIGWLQGWKLWVLTFDVNYDITVDSTSGTSIMSPYGVIEHLPLWNRKYVIRNADKIRIFTLDTSGWITYNTDEIALWYDWQGLYWGKLSNWNIAIFKWDWNYKILNGTTLSVIATGNAGRWTWWVQNNYKTGSGSDYFYFRSYWDMYSLFVDVSDYSLVLSSVLTWNWTNNWQRRYWVSNTELYVWGNGGYYLCPVELTNWGISSWSWQYQTSGTYPVSNQWYGDTLVISTSDPAIKSFVQLTSWFEVNLWNLYPNTGTYTLSEYSSIDGFTKLQVNLTHVIPTNTNIKIYYSLDGGVSRTELTTFNSLVSMWATYYSLLVKAELKTTDTLITPELDKIEVYVSN